MKNRDVEIDIRKILDAVKGCYPDRDFSDVALAEIMASVAGAVAARHGVLRDRVIAAIDAGAKHTIIEDSLRKHGLGGPADSRRLGPAPEWLDRQSK